MVTIGTIVRLVGIVVVIVIPLVIVSMVIRPHDFYVQGAKGFSMLCWWLSW